MSAISSDPTRTFTARLFGSKVQYICPMPLEDCLEQLQRASDLKTTTWIARNKVFITIIYANPNKYRYLIHHVWSKHQVAYRNRVRGTLERLDAENTSVVIDYQINVLEKALFILLMAAGLMPFILAAGIPLRALADWEQVVTIGGMIAGWAVDGLIFFSAIRSQDRTFKKLVPRISHVLPSI